MLSGDSKTRKTQTAQISTQAHKCTTKLHRLNFDHIIIFSSWRMPIQKWYERFKRLIPNRNQQDHNLKIPLAWDNRKK
jgi:hypothetical protein